MSKDLRIEILATVNEKLSTAEIKSQLEKIQKDLKIDIGIDANKLTDINKQIGELQKQMQGLTGKGLKIIDDKEAIANINKTQKGVTELYTNIDKAVQRYSKLGTVKTDGIFHPITRELQGFNLQVERADGLVDKLKLDLVKLATVDGQNAFEVVSRKQIDNTQQMLEKQLQQQTQINQKIIKEKEQEVDNRKKQEKEYEQWWLKSLKTQEISLEKNKDKLLQKLDEIKREGRLTEHQFLRLSKAINSVDNVKGLDKVKADLREVQGVLKNVGMFEQFKVAASRIPIWINS